MFSLRQYLCTLADPRGLTRTLGAIELCRDERGEPLYSAGNSAVVFRIRHEGRERSLRCYLRPMRRLREIYGSRLLEKELFLYDTPNSGCWVDAVLDDWIEGETLQQAVARAAHGHDTQRLARLAAEFDRLAAAMVADDCAHGDLKPENIIADDELRLHLIDFDASFLPAFAGEKSPELGTAAYQHPARTTDDYDARLDDYPAALISTALHALALDPTLCERYGDADGLLFTPQAIPDDPPYREALSLFERHGLAVQYRIARLLTSPVPALFGLDALLAYAVERTVATEPAPSAEMHPDGPAAAYPDAARPPEAFRTTANPAAEDAPVLFVEDGLWGYCSESRIVVPPLYDCGFDFSEGLAAVRLGTTWHYIDTAGRTRLSCPGCEAVKPFRGGRARIVRAGRRLEIDRTGRVFEI